MNADLVPEMRARIEQCRRWANFLSDGAAAAALRQMAAKMDAEVESFENPATAPDASRDAPPGISQDPQ